MISYGKCRHCGIPISYHEHDTVFIHDTITWGSGNILAHDFNNGYYCHPDRRTSASPMETTMKLCTCGHPKSDHGEGLYANTGACKLCECSGFNNVTTTKELAEKQVAARFGLSKKPKAGSQIAVMALAIWDELVSEYMIRKAATDELEELKSVHSLSNARRIINQLEAKVEHYQDLHNLALAECNATKERLAEVEEVLKQSQIRESIWEHRFKEGELPGA